MLFLSAHVELSPSPSGSTANKNEALSILLYRHSASQAVFAAYQSSRSRTFSVPLSSIPVAFFGPRVIFSEGLLGNTPVNV